MEQEHQVYFAFGVLLVSQEIISESNAPLFLAQKKSVTNPILPCTILRQCPACKTRIILHGFFFYLHLRRGGNTLLHTQLKKLKVMGEALSNMNLKLLFSPPLLEHPLATSGLSSKHNYSLHK